MTTEDSIILVFCFVDDWMKKVPEHLQIKLYPSKLVTIGLLCALKGVTFVPFIAGSNEIMAPCLRARPVARACNDC